MYLYLILHAYRQSCLFALTKLDANDDYLQLDDLYVEILYTILHMIGCEVKQEEQVELIIHLKNAFHMDEDRHRQLLETATMREVW